MGRRGKTEDLNNKPYDPNADARKKASEFDQQYQQNRKYTNTPNADKVVDKPKGRHKK